MWSLRSGASSPRGRNSSRRRRSATSWQGGSDMPLVPTPMIWMDGELVAWEEAKVHVLTHSLHYGTGVFEGIRAYPTDRGPAVFRLRDHIARLGRSARLLSMQMPYDETTLVEATR